MQILHISGSDKPVKFYNLDVIISVGYRVKSHQGTKFRHWATARLREYIVKGFTMNDELLKQAGRCNYFDELLVRILDICSSEKVFWRNVLDIYATGIDYRLKIEVFNHFFRMHKIRCAGLRVETQLRRLFANVSLPISRTVFKDERPSIYRYDCQNYDNQIVATLWRHLQREYGSSFQRRICAYDAVCESLS